MKTRTQYLNKECSHREYYVQFVTLEMKNEILNRFGKAKISKALQVNENLNSIPLAQWDSIGLYFLNTTPGLIAAFGAVGDSVTQSSLICLAKEAARQIV